MSEALRLFLIESDDDIALPIRTTLERAGHQVTCCRTAADALGVLGHTAFDLVLLGQRLPDLAGLDLLQTLARQGIAVPTLVVTAPEDEHLAARALRAGALDYVIRDPALIFLADLPKRVAESVKSKNRERERLHAQKMQSISTLAGGVAHEFNNLLTGINGYAVLGLREANLSGEVREFLQHILDLSERAARLTRQLLTFARKPALCRLPTSMADLVRGTADQVAHTLRVKVGLDLQGQTADGRPLLVEGDVNQLQEVLVNLALNARDACSGIGSQEPGPRDQELAGKDWQRTDPRLVVSAGSSRVSDIVFRLRHALLPSERPAFPQPVPPGDYVLLEVADTGSGMLPAVLARALDPFFTTKDVGQGTGLGLAVVMGIVQAHQGCLTIDSTPGRGTCVGLYLPRLVEKV